MYNFNKRYKLRRKTNVKDEDDRMRENADLIKKEDNAADKDIKSEAKMNELKHDNERTR